MLEGQRKHRQGYVHRFCFVLALLKPDAERWVEGKNLQSNMSTLRYFPFLPGSSTIVTTGILTYLVRLRLSSLGLTDLTPYRRVLHPAQTREERANVRNIYYMGRTFDTVCHVPPLKGILQNMPLEVTPQRRWKDFLHSGLAALTYDGIYTGETVRRPRIYILEYSKGVILEGRGSANCKC